MYALFVGILVSICKTDLPVPVLETAYHKLWNFFPAHFSYFIPYESSKKLKNPRDCLAKIREILARENPQNNFSSVLASSPQLEDRQLYADFH